MRSRQAKAAQRAAAWLLALVVAVPVTMAAEVPQPEPEPEVLRAAALMDAWDGDFQRLEGARRELEAALQRHRQSAPAHREFARYLINSGMINSRSFKPGSLEAALDALDRAIALAPHYADAHVLRGHVLTLMNRLGEADRAFDQAASIGTRDPWLALNRAELRLEQGRIEEAGAECRSVATEGEALGIRTAADECLIDYLVRAGKGEQAEAIYQRLLSSRPDSAWTRGNYARYQLCTRKDPVAAAREARAALAMMDYGHARFTLAEALYREWAVQWEAGRREQARALFDEARTRLEDSPEAVITGGCGDKQEDFRGLVALYRSGHLPARSPADAIERAVERHGTPGVFEVVVRGTGRDKHAVYANSLPDYRDPDCLTVRFARPAAKEIAGRHGQPAEQLLMDKRIVVVGYVRRERIDIHRDGKTVGHYFQTHLWVTDATQVLELRPAAGAKGGEPVVSL